MSTHLSKTELSEVGNLKWDLSASWGGERESVDSDFRNYRNKVRYCRNQVEWLCIRVPRIWKSYCPSNEAQLSAVDFVQRGTVAPAARETLSVRKGNGAL
ncbi:hypothetical protein TNCV_65281 [Trichonephila clavipes]|nr:hypothetical protein TNCV_65281 [Trichonephila clavipes]